MLCKINMRLRWSRTTRYKLDISKRKYNNVKLIL